MGKKTPKLSGRLSKIQSHIIVVFNCHIIFISRLRLEVICLSRHHPTNRQPLLILVAQVRSISVDELASELSVAALFELLLDDAGDVVGVVVRSALVDEFQQDCTEGVVGVEGLCFCPGEVKGDLD